LIVGVTLQNRIEKKIQRMLMVGKHPKEVFEELTLYLFRKKISDEEKISILKFGLNAGLHKGLMSVFSDMFHDKHVIPWHIFMDILAKNNVTIPKEVVESVLKGVKRQGREEDLTFIKSWDDKDQRFAEIRKEFTKQRQEDFGQKKNQMYEKLNFYRSQRMFHEEEKLLKIMSRMFPKDIAIYEEMQRFQEANAHEIIARNSLKDSPNDFIFNIEKKLSKAEQVFLASLKTYVLETVRTEKRTAYNFAIMFRMMGQPKMALEVIAHAIKDLPTAWLEIDLLLEAGMDVQCLDKIHEIELRYCDDPETTFAGTYARARALHNLGQGAKAIDLLKSILDVRPDYRSANSLLTEWAQRWV
jgi:tetratricopeptide (TPR) repeat protein